MNERQPYEKHLAEKLQNLPPPGEVDESWEQMRILLDKEMPRGGGMPGRRRWWLFSIAIGVLFLATWLSGERFLDDREKTMPVAQTLPQPDQGSGNAVVPDGKVPLVPTTRPASAAQQPAAAGDGQPAAIDKGIDNSRAVPITAAGKKVPERDEGTVVAASAIKKKVSNDRDKNRQPNADETIITFKDNSTQKNNNSYTPPGKKKPTGKQNNGPGDDITFNERTHAGNKTSKPGNDAAMGILAEKNPFLPKPSVENMRSSAVRAPLHYTDKPGPVLASGTTIEKDYARKNGGLPPERVAAQKTSAKKKLQKSREAGVFAVGLSLPLAFPLGEQRAMGYNLWAGHNTVSDYLPSPHLQYHLSRKTFLQTEAQLMSPQFIRSTMLYYHVTPLSPNYYTTNAVYAKKLYYFNIPVSIHHSPFPGFYMGTGIQFSSMISGVALSEERKVSPSGSMLVKESYTRFKNDSLSNMINGNEFRVLLDANYYFNRFTVGLRYNQALSNYISFRLAPGTPYSFDKNRALQFYMRYNLWEDKKRSNPNKTMLTLK